MILSLVFSGIAIVLCLVELVAQIRAYYILDKCRKRLKELRLQLLMDDVFMPDPKSLMDYGSYQSPCSLSEQSREVRFMPPIIDNK